MLSILSSPFYSMISLPLKAEVLQKLVHSVSEISVPILCCTYFNEAFTCYSNKLSGPPMTSTLLDTTVNSQMTSYFT